MIVVALNIHEFLTSTILCLSKCCAAELRFAQRKASKPVSVSGDYKSTHSSCTSKIAFHVAHRFELQKHTLNEQEPAFVTRENTSRTIVSKPSKLSRKG